MTNPQILYPIFAMFALVSFVLFRLGYLRAKAVREHKIHPRHYKLMQGETESPVAIATARNYSNLFEMPVFFYVALITAYVAIPVSQAMIVTAWIYVFFRISHTLSHITTNHVPTRFGLFIVSNVALLVLWVQILVSLLSK